MDFCGFFQGKSSEFACIPEIPYAMHPLKKSPIMKSNAAWASQVSRLERPASMEGSGAETDQASSCFEACCQPSKVSMQMSMETK